MKVHRNLQGELIVVFTGEETIEQLSFLYAVSPKDEKEKANIEQLIAIVQSENKRKL